MDEHQDAVLVVDALTMALARTQPEVSTVWSTTATRAPSPGSGGRRNTGLLEGL